MRVEAYKGYENKEGSKHRGAVARYSFCPVIKKKESNVGVGGKDSTDAKEKKSENVESKCPVKKVQPCLMSIASPLIQPTICRLTQTSCHGRRVGPSIRRESSPLYRRRER